MSEETGAINNPASGATGEGAANPAPSTPAAPAGTEQQPAPAAEIKPQEGQNQPQGATPTNTGTSTPIEADIPLEGLKYAGFDVQLAIPKDVANFCQQNGLDAEAITRELYESPDFKLSEEKLQPLYDKFGKWQVDAFFDGIKAKNEAILQEHKTTTETRAAQEKAAWDSTMEIMEGEDRWNDMSEWALKNLTPDEVDEFNHVMQNGTVRVQALMIRDMFDRFKQAGAPVAPAAPAPLELEEGSNDNNQQAIQALSQVEYHKILASGEYRKDPAKYDAMRRLGMQKGL